MHSHIIIRDRLKAELEKRGMTAMDLARAAGVKTSFIYDILNGKSTNPSTVKLAMVAEALGVSLTWLAGGESGGGADMAAIAPLSSGKKTAEKDGYVYFKRAWLRESLDASPEKLRSFTAPDESMEPALRKRDLLLVDTSRTRPSPPGIFVLSDGMGLAVRRLEAAGGKPPMVRVMSDNPQYGAHERRLAEVDIIGRVVWFARKL